ncbi:YigZ family protein [Hydrogenoanaerobacterium sp.]|uniref:YigZ family protein n=1 Tax=Hydrogenoanaerobacterium sp. TaxID=2953763 RepID=UPI00289AEADE|nr:YigZ family protein [Hydrogenoanaerobacterium sp.]
MEQGYKTIYERAEDEFIERKSRFIGCIQPVTTEEEALAFIAEKRSQHRDATHNVFAYVLRDGFTKRCSDDGEPQGTAGVPVLDVLQKEGLVDVCVVVTRYFGGTLLGAGGLVRAYSHGAKLAVDVARVMHMNPCTILEMEFDYALYGKISYILPKYNTVTLQSDFGVVVKLKIMMTSDKVEAFRKELDELTAAAVFPYVTEEKFADLE